MTPSPASATTNSGTSSRILIVALNYHPELVGCAKYTTELAEYLSDKGHEVEVICAPPYYPAWKISEGYSGARWQRSVVNGVTVNRVPLYVPSKPTGLSRVLHLASFGLSSMPAAIKVAYKFQPHLVFAIAPTLTCSISALFAAKLSKARKWLHIQDFEVDAAFGLGILNNTQVRSAAIKVEEFLLRQFDMVSTISPTMLQSLRRKGVKEERSFELRNWVDVDAITVRETSATLLRKELGISETEIVALYSGNMAAKQGIEMLGDVAEELQLAGSNVKLLICGDGPAKSEIEQRCRNLNNVKFLPLQPLNRLSELLATADIHLLPQRPEAADLVLPSKLTGMLASGRPTVAMAEIGTGLAGEVEGCGIAVPPSAQAMTAAILALAENRDLRRSLGLAARSRAETRWHKAKILKAFEEMALSARA